MKPTELVKVVPKPAPFFYLQASLDPCSRVRGENPTSCTGDIYGGIYAQDFLHSTELSSPSHDANMDCLECSTSSDSSKGKYDQLSAF